ncbi:MAG: winged helix-turn-helix domain-containing protein [Methanomassiliicoccales archaeon]|jgi:predicted transcriptional regulator
MALERPDIYVLSRLLDRLWREDGPMLRTRLQVGTNLSYDNLVRYLQWMQERGLIEFNDGNDGHQTVLLTAKGKDAYSTVVLWINEMVSEQRSRR